MSNNLTTLNDAALLFGVTKGAINQHRRRNPDLWTDEHITTQEGSTTLVLTEKGLDLLSQLITTPEAEEYRATRERAGLSLALVEDNTLTITLDPLGSTSTSSLPDPEVVGEAIAAKRFEKDMAEYTGAVNQHAAQSYERRLDEVTVTLGETLAGTWGLPVEYITALLEGQPTSTGDAT